MLPEVAVLIPTFNRGQLLAENLGYLQANLCYSGPLKLVIGDDSTDDNLAFDPESIDWCEWPLIYQRHRPRKGLGANLNWLHYVCAGHGIEYAIQMDDDHRLRKPLDLDPHVNRLIEDKDAGWIRLMGVAGHRLTARLDGSYWRVDWHSDELYITSNRPHLKKVIAWDGIFGPYYEGLKLGATEEAYCHTCIDRARAWLEAGAFVPDVLIPLNQDDSAWTESGHSWQLQGE